ncbi:WxcM-like domain-containing protein [Aminipila butyrica]|uniref:WxcM-like domain-containing protein n=1 Tax=Aminipila butyrica TaxID=433296 RepID=A0A858BSS9_9FIRM|nr:FdtA/QdtA family cupin domain-containing protein [Aminipila butyrica]QIB68165.1 WxcM-like domain-containing protein [Aminipila butyrica]
MDVKKIEFNQRNNTTGKLTFLEAKRDIPFEIKRIYYVYDVAKGERRGFHAHKELEQYLICIHGGCTILLDDGLEKENVLLNNPSEGLYVGPGTWREMYGFSEGAVLLVLASEYYDEADYIRDYSQFKRYITDKEA